MDPSTGTIPNPWNDILRQRADDLTHAFRGPISPGCAVPPLTPAAPNVQRNSLLRVPINCFTAGDNFLIPTLIGRKLIYEIHIWNVAAQTLALYQGSSATGILLTRWTAFPALTGVTLGFNGNFAMPHFQIDPGQPFTLNLENSTQVDGFVVYRNETTGNF
jgi:hypothetical protein